MIHRLIVRTGTSLAQLLHKSAHHLKVQPPTGLALRLPTTDANHSNAREIAAMQLINN